MKKKSCYKFFEEENLTEFVFGEDSLADTEKTHFREVCLIILYYECEKQQKRPPRTVCVFLHENVTGNIKEKIRE